VRRTGLIIALCLGAILISGCGGSSSDSSSTETTTSQSAPQNAEESIEGFGEEAEGEDREALISAFRGYFGALAEGDDAKACESLSAKVTESLQRLAAKAKKDFSCEQLLEALLSPDAKQIAKGQAQGEIRKIRIEGDTAFIVFHAPGARLYQLTMVEEEGQWKATSLAASVLAPSLNR
jgi:hypothetical protein